MKLVTFLDAEYNFEVYWMVMPWSFVGGCQRFGASSCLVLQGLNIDMKFVA